MGIGSEADKRSRASEPYADRCAPDALEAELIPVSTLPARAAHGARACRVMHRTNGDGHGRWRQPAGGTESNSGSV
jgi:hypothetical protein